MLLMLEGEVNAETVDAFRLEGQTNDDCAVEASVELDRRF